MNGPSSEMGNTGTGKRNKKQPEKQSNAALRSWQCCWCLSPVPHSLLSSCHSPVHNWCAAAVTEHSGDGAASVCWGGSWEGKQQLTQVLTGEKNLHFILLKISLHAWGQQLCSTDTLMIWESLSGGNADTHISASGKTGGF